MDALKQEDCSDYQEIKIHVQEVLFVLFYFYVLIIFLILINIVYTEQM
jgi:hypothetical protein